MSTIGLGGLLYLLLRHGQYLGVYPDGVMKRPGVRPRNCVVLKTRDGANLHCSLFLARSSADNEDAVAKGTIIIFHGNGVIVQELCPLGMEISTMDYHVLLAEYRG
ncbi:hypothetical protein BD779DRAFT_781485 [Infundibulicybe gibba]|nr:hypothetical protein BD779DRAFT_781485 [Infundibulicybe gibba]